MILTYNKERIEWKLKKYKKLSQKKIFDYELKKIVLLSYLLTKE
jgi:hypothetical protein